MRWRIFFSPKRNGKTFRTEGTMAFPDPISKDVVDITEVLVSMKSCLG
jgi:hypothetical protein